MGCYLVAVVIDLRLHAAKLVERLAPSRRAQALCAASGARLPKLSGDGALARLVFLLLRFHAVELGFHVQDRGSLLRAEGFGAITITDHALLLAEGLPGELLVVGA